MQLNPYLTFNGNAEEALEFYRSALGGKLDIMRFEGTPAAKHAPAGWDRKVLHGRLETSAGVIMASDATPEQGGQPGSNFSIAIGTDDEAQTEAVFSKLAAGGKVTMPLEETFWSKRFGMLVDKFGITWLVNCVISPVGAQR